MSNTRKLLILLEGLLAVAVGLALLPLSVLVEVPLGLLREALSAWRARLLRLHAEVRGSL